MTTALWWGVLLVAAYALGTFPSAAIIARRRGIEITRTGSGNPGASNIARTLGWRAGVVVYGLDATKGALAALAGLVLLGRPGAYALGAAAIIGHIAPLTRRLRGGKGVATASGVLVIVHPILAPIVIAMWWALVRITHRAAVASIITVVAVPVALAIAGTPLWEIIATLAICSLIVVRHTGNIGRLLRREEHRLIDGEPARSAP